MKKILFWLILVVLVTACTKKEKMLTSEQITFNERKSNYIIKNASNKPVSSLVEIYNTDGVMTYIIEFQDGQYVNKHTKINFSDIYDIKYLDNNDLEDYFEDFVEKFFEGNTKKRTVFPGTTIPITGLVNLELRDVIAKEMLKEVGMKLKNIKGYTISIPYVDGYISGDVTGRYFDDNDLGSVTFKDNEMDGSGSIYFPNGNLAVKFKTEKGMFIGDYVEYYDNQKVSSQTHYKNGRIDGLYISYDKDGNIISKIKYQNGQIIDIEDY